MELKLKLLLITLCLIFMLFVYKKVAKGNLQLKYSISWYTVSIILILLTIFDNLLIPIKDFLGFETTSNMIFLFGFLTIAMLVFSLYINISMLNQKNTKLTQEVALLKKDLESYEQNKRTNK